MRKSVFSFLLAVVLSIAALTSFTVCSKDRVIKDGKTVNVKVYKAGYNSEYIYDLKEKFESIYKEEGYKVNILAPARDIEGTRVLQDIYTNSGIDVYFTNGINLDQALYGTYGKTLADLTELVYKESPIRFNGTEEDGTVLEKLKGNTNYDIFDGDSIYGLPYVEGIGGLVFNHKVLTEDYGLDIPRTSNELFHCYDVIMTKSDETGVFPYTYIAGQNNYPAHLTNVWMAQYGGVEWFDTFWTMTNGNGKMISDGFSVFADDPVEEMLTCLFESFDPMAAAYGSSTQDIATAQAQIMRGTAVFMSTGDYFFNEESLSFSNKLHEISITNIPVISSLGVKLFGASTAYGFTEDQCEQILCAVIDQADQNQSVAQIVAAVGQQFGFQPTDADIAEICAARGITYNRANRMNAYISEKSEMKEVAALFLRMCASDDGAKAISAKTYASNPFSSTPLNTDSEYTFLRAASSIVNNRYLMYIEDYMRGFRSELGLNTIFPYTGMYVHDVVFNKGKTIYNDRGQVIRDKSIYRTEAAVLAKEIADHAETNWSRWLSSINLG